MAVAASSSNADILQVDWLTSGRIFPVLSAQEGIKKALLMSNKNYKFWQNMKWKGIMNNQKRNGSLVEWSW